MKTVTLEGYRWISYYDEAEEKRFSDWDRCTACSTCGRKIVHVYLLSDGYEYGKECVHLALGWKRADHKKIQVLLYEREQEKKAIEQQGAIWAEMAVEYPELAITLCVNRNHSSMRADLTRSETVVFEKESAYVAVPVVCKATAMKVASEYGWKRRSA